MINFSLKRVYAIARKEFIKIKFDPTVLGMILAIPFLQIILFGYAIEFFPKHLPTAVISYDHSPFTRRLIQSMQSTQFFTISYGNEKESSAKKLLQEGKVNYILTIPAQFTRDLIRGNSPHVLLEADASSPGIMAGPIQAMNDLQRNTYERFLPGALSYLAPKPSAFQIDIHPVYNPNLLSTHTVIPPLIGVILMLSLSLVTSMSIIEEKEGGNIEVLLNTHVQPLEILFGKFLSYLIIGYVQLIIIFYVAGHLLFNVPMRGSLLVFLIVSFPFLIANLMLGLAASTIAASQLQAQQLVTFFFLPSLLLSGFLFPFYGMPYWAQIVGNLMPLTHYIRITTGIMLKDYGWPNILPELWPIIFFVIIVTFIAMLSFKKTLD